jgi:hypothetical protein
MTRVQLELPVSEFLGRFDSYFQYGSYLQWLETSGKDCYRYVSLIGNIDS